MQQFQLLLFSTDTDLIRKAVVAGVDAIIVDWENAGKHDRQQGADTQINSDTPDDLCRVRDATPARIICRINGFHEATPREVEKAISCGADEILLPMVRNASEVGEVLRYISDRCEMGILVETIEAVDSINELAKLPLTRIYVGLNDLAIQRGTHNIFEAVADGTVQRVRESCSKPFGFAGLTLPEEGRPIPCRLLIGEMARIRADFSFLRRSFHADIVERDMIDAVRDIRVALEMATLRTTREIEQDRQDLLRSIDAWPKSLDR